MHQLINYLAPTIVFIAVILGLLGPSRKPGVAGIAGISLFGWGLAALASISLLLTLSSAYKNQQELELARAEQVRIANVAKREIADGYALIQEVLRFAALMPYTTSSQLTLDFQNPLPYPKDPLGGWLIDLRSEKTLNVLENLYLDPKTGLNGPYIPSIVPFGTDFRPALTILSEESIKTTQIIETAVQKYAGSAISADLLEASSVLIRDPFIKHLAELRERWAERSRMEESDLATSLGFTFLNSGFTGSYKKDYLQLLDSMDQLRNALEVNGQK